MSITDVQFEASTLQPEAAHAIEGRSPWALAWARLRADKVAVASGVVIIVLCLLALIAPLIAKLVGHGPLQTFPNLGLTAQGLPVPPSSRFWFGTDDLGRDVLVRTLYGARVSLFVALTSTAIATVAGVVVGMVAGYLGGTIDMVLARVTDAVLVFPYVLLALALAAIFGSNVPEMIGVIAFFSWAGLARIVRGQTLSIREKEYVEAARAIGASPMRIMFVDILPNVVAQVLVISTLLIPVAVVFESTLSFLGAGVQLPTPSWGNMISVALQNGDYQTSWWFLVFPAAALLTTTLAFNLLGDGIRDALDPRTERIFAARRKRKKAPAAAPAAAAPAEGA